MDTRSPEFVATLKAKLPKTSGPCSFCGQRAKRDLVGLHWLGIDDVLDTQIRIPAPAHVPCAAVSCSACGNVWLLSLLALGVVAVQPPPQKPTLTLIEGGAGED